MVRSIIIIYIFSLLQSCFCYKGRFTGYGQPRKDIKIDKTFNEKVFEVIDTLAVYEDVVHIFNADSYRADNSKGKKYMRFYDNGKFGVFGIGYDNKNYKSIPNYEMSRKDLDPQNSQMGYYYSDNNKIYAKRLIMNQCRVEVFENELIVKGDTIIAVNLGSRGGKSIYIKRKVPKDYLKNWKPDW